MFDHEIRWTVLVPVSILLGIAMLATEIAGLWFRPDMRPDAFWCLAFAIAMRTTTTQAIMAFAWCGLARDLMLGPRAGSAAIAFIAVGWIVLHLRYAIVSRGLLGQLFAVGATAFLAALARHGLDAGRFAGRVGEAIPVLAAGDAVLTLAAYAPLCAVLALDQFRPWRRGTSFMF